MCDLYLFIVCTGKLIVKSLRSWSLYKPDSYDYWMNSNTVWINVLHCNTSIAYVVSRYSQSLQKGISGKRPIITTADDVDISDIDYTVWTTGSVCLFRQWSWMLDFITWKIRSSSFYLCK